MIYSLHKSAFSIVLGLLERNFSIITLSKLYKLLISYKKEMFFKVQLLKTVVLINFSFTEQNDINLLFFYPMKQAAKNFLILLKAKREWASQILIKF